MKTVRKEQSEARIWINIVIELVIEWSDLRYAGRIVVWRRLRITELHHLDIFSRIAGCRLYVIYQHVFLNFWYLWDDALHSLKDTPETFLDEK